MHKATEKPNDAAKKMGKPSQANAKVLVKPFPAYSGGVQKRKFNPNDDSVVAKQHHQKKAAFKGKGNGRSKAVLVMVLKEKTLTVPKSVKRDSLKEEGRAKVFKFYRYMRAEKVNDLLTKTFLNSQPIQFLFLKTNKKNMLTVVENLKVDWNDVFEVAKGGSLYLTCLNTSERSSTIQSAVSQLLTVPRKSYMEAEIEELLQKTSKTVKRL